jgi:uncharacterized protein (TIGR03083 family)
MTAVDDRALVERLAEVWASVIGVCADLDEPAWRTPTECPGWSVQDNVAHLIGIESTLLGIATPDVDVAERPHVRNDIGRMNEQWVEHYRRQAGAEVLDAFRAVSGRRLEGLRALDDTGFDADSWTPVGPGTVRDLLPFRIFDSWVHEQDVRRALGRPGDLDTAAGRLCLDRLRTPMGMVVGKRVAPGDGTTVVFAVSGAFDLALQVVDGRARTLDDVPASPTVRLAMPTDTFVRLATGRGDPEAILAGGTVVIDGDATLGRAVATQMNFLF